MYNYYDAVKKDLIQFLAEDDGYRFNEEYYDGMSEEDAKPKMVNDIYNITYDSDMVTGNCMGYAMPEECRDWIYDGNLELAYKAVTTMCDLELWESLMQTLDYVCMDANIRGYLLEDVIKDVVNDIWKYCEKVDDLRKSGEEFFGYRFMESVTRDELRNAMHWASEEASIFRNKYGEIGDNAETELALNYIWSGCTLDHTKA